MTDYEKIAYALGELDEPQFKRALSDAIGGASFDVNEAIRACQAGLAVVGERFDAQEYFVGDLIFAGELMDNAFAQLKPFMAGDAGASGGKIVLCTVEGDLHDIGKNIVRCMLEANGFTVIDLGVDVPPEKIVEALRNSGAAILALSGVLTLAIPSMKRTVAALCEAGLRERTKVIIGGASIDERASRITGADAWTVNAAQGVRICREWLGA